MKKLLLLWFFLLATPVFAQVTQTPNLGLNIIPPGTVNWGPMVNANFVDLDTEVVTLHLNCSDGQVPMWAAGKFSICSTPATSTLDPTQNVNWIGQFTINAKQVCLQDGTNCPSAGSESDPVISKLVGIVTSNGTTPVARSMATASTNNILITNPTGSGGNPTWDVGANVALTTRSFTATTGDWNFGAAASLTPPNIPGAAPTANFRIAGNTTSSRLVYGIGGSTFIVAHTGEIQPFNANLSGLAGLTGAAATIPYFTGPAAMDTLTMPLCIDSGGQHLNVSSLSPLTVTCGTSGGGSISGLVAGNVPKAASPTSLTPSIMSEAAGVVTIAGGFVVGTGSKVGLNTAALTIDRTWTIQDAAGTILPAAAAGTFTNNHVLKAVVAGGVVTIADGGVAGTGDVTLAGPNVMNNTTLDESAGNIVKITKGIQVELFGPTTDTTSGNGQYYFRVPVGLNGTNLIGIQSNTVTAGTTGLTSVQITRCAAVATSPLCSGTTASMLSTVLSIDSGETSSSTAATPVVINAANDDVATGQILRFDVTAIHTTAAKGLIVNLDFKLP